MQGSQGLPLSRRVIQPLVIPQSSIILQQQPSIVMQQSPNSALQQQPHISAQQYINSQIENLRISQFQQLSDFVSAPARLAHVVQISGAAMNISELDNLLPQNYHIQSGSLASGYIFPSKGGSKVLPYSDFKYHFLWIFFISTVSKYPRNAKVVLKNIGER